MDFLLFTLTAELHDEGEDLPRMLRRLADRIEEEGIACPRRHPLLDLNGNKVGVAELLDMP